METLDTTGFLLTEVAGEWAVLSADFGDGYEAGALIGDPRGTRTWTIRIDALPDSGGALISGLPRSQYLWRFFQARKTLNNEPFWLEADDPDDGLRKLFLVSFVERRLAYTLLCAKLYSTGLQLRERRVTNVESPIAA